MMGTQQTNRRRRLRLRTALAVVCAAVLATVAGCVGGANAPEQPAPAPTGTSTPPPPAEALEAPEVNAAKVPGEVLRLPGGAPKGAVVDSKSKLLAVALRDPARIALLDTRTRELRTIPSPGAARHLAVGVPGELLVMGENTDILARIALPSGKVIQKTKVGNNPHDAAQVGNTVFVANEFGGSVSVVRDGRTVAKIGRFVQPGGVSATAGRVAVVDVRANKLHVIDARTLRRVEVLPAGKGPSHVRPVGGGRVIVADTRGNAVRLYDLTGKPRQLSTLQLSGRPYGLAADAKRGVAYVTLSTSNKVVRVQVEPDGSMSVKRVLPTVQQPNSVTVDTSTNTVYVIGKADGTVQVIPASKFTG